MNVADIHPVRLAAAYLLLLIPLGIMLWHGVDLVGRTVLGAVRMTAQLLFVGLYLQVVFEVNNFFLSAAWLLVMIAVADFSIVRGCGLAWRRFAAPLFLALVGGTVVPLVFFMGPILDRPQWLDARYAIPIGGMVLGNCLRADIVGVRTLYQSVRRNEKSFLYALAQGARLPEALRPYLREAFQTALAPTIATMSTIGLVSLPGMMTGAILGGADPLRAIKYQIAIMIAILSGTAITIALAVRLTRPRSFDAFGVLDQAIFVQRAAAKDKKQSVRQAASQAR